ncbi:MAG: glycosyltransferase [Pseudomonadota bacterium]
MNTPLVSAVIPCFNQAHFLSEAIDSLLAQSYSNIEIIVVDDGSTDNTADVVSCYANVQLLRQRNSGLAAARNSGIRASQGDYLIFLDADDLLLPNAVEKGFVCLQKHPDSAFASGRYRLLTPDGSAREPHIDTPMDKDPYTALLRGNHIAMHATVMYRRQVLEVTGGYNASLPVCEDYDLYLRIARQYQIARHKHVIAEYRKHGTNISYNSPLMLETVLSILYSQRQHIEANSCYSSAFRAGICFWKEFYGLRAIRRIAGMMVSGQRRQAREDTLSLIASVGVMQLLLCSPVWLIKYLLRENGVRVERG